MDTNERLEREKSFHNERFGGSDSERTPARKYYSANKHAKEKFVAIIASLCDGSRLLEYGCGTGEHSKQWNDLGAVVTGIDISDEGVKVATQNSRDKGFDAKYFVMDAENTDFNDSSFDLVVGEGILHHLDLEKCYSELARVCAKDGHIVFFEPLGHNPIINIYRALTPKMRTEDEHPLKMRDIDLLDNYFDIVECEYFAFFTLLSVPFVRTRFFNQLHNVFKRIDELVLSLPLLKRCAWLVVVHAHTPKVTKA